MKGSAWLFICHSITRRCFILLMLSVMFVVCLSSQNQNLTQRRDSLHNVLQQTDISGKKISVLKKLALLYWQQPEEVPYLSEMVDVATQMDSINTVYAALGSLCRYYYNANNLDSLLYWKSQIDSLSQNRNEYPEAVFRAGSNLCQLYLAQGDHELAMNEAVQMLNIAESKHLTYGLIRANENLGIIYQTIDCDSDAMVVFRKGMEWLKKGPDNSTLELQLLVSMIRSSLRLNHLEESEKLLKQYEDVLNLAMLSYEKQGIKYPMVWHVWLINSYYAELSVRENQPQKASVYLDKATLAVNASTNDEMKYPYFRASALYYMNTQNYPLALDAIEKAMKIDYTIDMLKMKVDVLRSAGRWREALHVYDELLMKNVEISNKAFTRQIEQLRSLNDLNDMEIHERELAYQKEQITIKQYQVIAFGIIALMLLSLLYILGRYYLRTHRLKNELQYERSSLVESEKEYRQAKDEAETANRMKTTFISNISHEVRTPLNAIVGFSELLADDSCSEDEKVEFANTITINSELLLNLVNDVLDLSRLEAGNLTFNIKPVDLIACCQEAMSAIDRRVAEEVRLTFTPCETPYLLHTDPFRLQQLLVNLLTNAAKFTEQGEINLSFEEDKETNQLCFAVTDTGCGIPLDKQSRIFERFEKLDEFMQGTGLGLSICQIIASRFGGTIYIDPTYTQGARFIFTHPLGENVCVY